MTYRAAIHGLSHLGIPDHPCPAVYCDGCGAKHEARTDTGCAPVWLLKGKAPKGWRVERGEDGTIRKDWCPKCKTMPPSGTDGGPK